MKLCKDCQHSVKDDYLDTLRCGHPKVEPSDLGTGARERCDAVRRWGACGKDAKLFEAKYLHSAGPPPDYVTEHIRLQQQAMLGMQNMAQYQAQAMQNRQVMHAPQAVVYGNTFAGLVSGYPTAVSPFDIDMTRTVEVSAPAEWPEPAEPEPEIHPFLVDKPRSHWKFTAPSWRSLIACLVFGGLIALGVRMVLL